MPGACLRCALAPGSPQESSCPTASLLTLLVEAVVVAQKQRRVARGPVRRKGRILQEPRHSLSWRVGLGPSVFPFKPLQSVEVLGTATLVSGILIC